jgi:hypothetical protein
MTTTLDIAAQQHLLNTHRSTLARLLQQGAKYGDEWRAPPSIVVGIHDVRQEIQRIKLTLREWNVAVSDHPDDQNKINLLSPHTMARLNAPIRYHPIELAPSPPEFATYLLWYLPMHKKTREAVMGDLEEEFSIVSQRFGRREAIIWYYYQVGASFWPFAVSGVKKLIKWGVLGWIGEALRRFIS